MGWPLELVWDASKIGGASVRMVRAKGERTVRRHQARLARLYARVVAYALVKAEAAGLLPRLPDDWMAHTYTLPPRLTVDNGRDTRADIDKYKLGMISGQDFCGDEGDNWFHVTEEKIAEQKFLLEKCREAGVDPARVQMLTPNGEIGQAEKPEETEEPDAKEKPEETEQ
jgi:hypothetical protein